MRRIALAAVLALTLAVVGTGCEPKMTITAKPSKTKLPCGSEMTVGGTVKPYNATETVTIQYTKAGKWVDYQAAVGGGDPDYDTERVDMSNPFEGTYEFGFLAPYKATTLHLRVRSKGGSTVSNSFYVTTYATSGHRCY